MRKNQERRNNIYIILTPLVALIAPFLVFIIEQPLPYPYIVEELAKAVFAYLILSEDSLGMKKIGFAALIALLFSLSETVLYLFNLYVSNTVTVVFQRLIFTSSMHAVTLVIMVTVGMVNKKYLPLGILLGVIIHYSYNRLLGY
jgi:hypothetical protein